MPLISLFMQVLNTIQVPKVSLTLSDFSFRNTEYIPKVQAVKGCRPNQQCFLNSGIARGQNGFVDSL
jgi:hypothetical protein